MFDSKFLRRFANSLIKKLWLVVFVAMVFFVFSLAMTYNPAPDSYSARVTLLSTANLTYSEVIQGRQAFRDYREIIGSRRVASRAAQNIAEFDISPERIQSMITTMYMTDSAILTIEASSLNSQEVVPVANAVASAFISELRNVTALSGFRILDEATSYQTRSSGSSDRRMLTLLITVIGAVLAAGVIMLFEVFNTKIRGVEDISAVDNAEVIGVVPTHRI